ncbi:MAG: ferrochelatase [Planctomycetaceae bacterium]|nr:ferrochelatase [Planctomycetaceae bacterium]
MNDIDTTNAIPFDALLIVSYGGPEHEDEVVPFIENVLAGRKATPELIEKTVEKYQKIGNVSPINEECRALIRGLLQKTGDVVLPIYWGNLFWHPMLDETIAAMTEDGFGKIIAFCTVPFETEHSLRSYTSAIDTALKKTGISDISVTTTKPFGCHELYLDAVTDRLLEILDYSPWDAACDMILFTAHSVPKTDAALSNYVQQLRMAGLQVIERLKKIVRHSKRHYDWDLAFQSRSGGNPNAWCGPDIHDFVSAMPEKWPQKKRVVVSPVGFLLENAELLYDLDIETSNLCHANKLEYVRAFAAGSHPNMIALMRRLILDSGSSRS